jgi:hypothetical protein
MPALACFLNIGILINQSIHPREREVQLIRWFAGSFSLVRSNPNIGNKENPEETLVWLGYSGDFSLLFYR